MDISPQNNFKAWNEYFVKKYDIDDYYKKSNIFVRFIEKMRHRHIIRLTESKASEEIIELGCGAGHILSKIKNGRLYGLDISFLMLEKAKKRLGKKAVLFLGDCQNLPQEVKNITFDKIIISEVLEHTAKPKEVIAETVSILKENGAVVISVPNEPLINFFKNFLRFFGVFKKFFSNIAEKMDEEWHLHKFNLKMLKETTNGKLKIIKIKRAPFFFLPIRYVVKFQKT